MLIAPLSANTLAKVSHGLCDNLLTCVVRAWDFSKPLLVAPAMNTHMWSHPFTAPQLDVLRRLGVVVIPPISKRLACGDVGVGAMAAVESIVAAVKEAAQALSQSAQPVPSSSSIPQ
jgi:phosphopantothenoylcysteine decarboxylase